jgi:hypothetical protein
MSVNKYNTPEESFTNDLAVLPEYNLQVLDSRVQRQLDYEYVAEGEPNPETEFRHHDLDDEFRDRDIR